MKQLRILLFFALTTPSLFVACNTGGPKVAGADTASSITFPYAANYNTDWSYDVSDSDLLLVLNSYKYWENGDLTALRSTMGDSMRVDGDNGFKFNGLADSLMKTWQTFRD